MIVNGFYRFAKAISTMLSKNDLKFIRSLGTVKFRKRDSVFIAEGNKVINEFLDEGWELVDCFSTDLSLFNNYNTTEVSFEELKKISFLTNPKNSLAIFKMKEWKSPDLLDLKGRISLVCDNIQDPGNLGTIIRIADWFGVNHVVCSFDTVDAYNPKVVQGSMGSLARVVVTYVDLKSWLEEVGNEIPIVVSSLDGTNIYEADLPSTALVILGNEGRGVSNEIQMPHAMSVLIPGIGKAESLNVSVSAGIICSEFYRRNFVNLRK